MSSLKFLIFRLTTRSSFQDSSLRLEQLLGHYCHCERSIGVKLLTLIMNGTLATELAPPNAIEGSPLMAALTINE